MIRMHIRYRLPVCSQEAYLMLLDMKRHKLVGSYFYTFYDIWWICEVKVRMFGIVIATDFAV